MELSIKYAFEILKVQKITLGSFENKRLLNNFKFYYQYVKELCLK